MNRHRVGRHTHDGTRMLPPPRGALRTAYLIFLVGVIVSCALQIAYAVLCLIAVTSPTMSPVLPLAIFGLGALMTAALGCGAWILHRLRELCPYADQALSAPA